MTDLQKLKERASKATPGPWFRDGNGVDSGPPSLDWIAMCEDDDVDSAVHYNNAAYIAAASPDVVLRLCEVADAASAYLVAYEGEDPVGESMARNRLRAALHSLDGKGQEA